MYSYLEGEQKRQQTNKQNANMNTQTISEYVNENAFVDALIREQMEYDDLYLEYYSKYEVEVPEKKGYDISKPLPMPIVKQGYEFTPWAPYKERIKQAYQDARERKEAKKAEKELAKKRRIEKADTTFIPCEGMKGNRTISAKKVDKVLRELDLPENEYNKMAIRLAYSILGKVLRKSPTYAHYRMEFLREIVSEIGATFVAQSDSLETFVKRELKDVPFAYWKHGFRACDRLIRKLSHELQSETAYLSIGDLVGPEFEFHASEWLKTELVSNRVKKLLSALNSKREHATNNRTRGLCNAVEKEILRAREYAIASIKSETFPLANPIAYESESEHGERVIRDAKGHYLRVCDSVGDTLHACSELRTDGHKKLIVNIDKQTHYVKQRQTRSLLWKRWERIQNLIGEEIEKLDV